MTNSITVTFIPEEDKDKYSEEEINAYIQRGREKYKDALRGIELRSVPEDPEMVDIYYSVNHVPFTRLRRITGYLVGNMTRWNNAKLAEEHDRVKHGVD
jgi:anaerobic ribonucleoside-triphosphate reductase